MSCSLNILQSMANNQIVQNKTHTHTNRLGSLDSKKSKHVLFHNEHIGTSSNMKLKFICDNLCKNLFLFGFSFFLSMWIYFVNVFFFFRCVFFVFLVISILLLIQCDIEIRLSHSFHWHGHIRYAMSVQRIVRTWLTTHFFFFLVIWYMNVCYLLFESIQSEVCHTITIIQ